MGASIREFNITIQRYNLDSSKFARTIENSEFAGGGGGEKRGTKDKLADSIVIKRETRSSLFPRSTDVGLKNNQQSSQSSNLPKSHMKSSEEVGGREKGRKGHKNVTIGDGICQSIDIRNSVVVFSILKDCRVIEGFLQIVLIENNTEADFENVSFPELREITGYFLLYRVDGLKSLSKLFPNLEVIRGDILLTDYAFMIYEMKNLQEVRFFSLFRLCVSCFFLVFFFFFFHNSATFSFFALR